MTYASKTTVNSLGRRAAKRPLFLIAAATVAAAVTVVFSASATAQNRSRIPAGNAILSRYVPSHFKPAVRSGRITGTSLRRNFPQIKVQSESLTIQADNSTGKMELRYEGPFRKALRVGNKRRECRLSVVLNTAGRLEIELAAVAQSKTDGKNNNNKKNPADSKQPDSDRAVTMRFLQRPGRRLTLSLGSGPKQRVIQADSIWELLIGHREDCRIHLLPILYRLRPGWNLMVTADQIEMQLLHVAVEGKSSQYARWHELVELLGHDSYSRREAADRELRRAGRRALTFLRKLDWRKLDVEQQFRIARIVRSFDGIEQTPREIAEEIRDDPAIWLVVALNDRESARRVALAELQRLLKRPVDFNPAAKAPAREDQLRKIGQHIAGE